MRGVRPNSPPTTTIVPLGGQAEDEEKPDPEAEAAKMFGLSHFVN